MSGIPGCETLAATAERGSATGGHDPKASFAAEGRITQVDNSDHCRQERRRSVLFKMAVSQKDYL
jgi:hypothetical protein